jgi:hypothetical protein
MGVASIPLVKPHVRVSRIRLSHIFSGRTLASAYASYVPVRPVSEEIGSLPAMGVVPVLGLAPNRHSPRPTESQLHQGPFAPSLLRDLITTVDLSDFPTDRLPGYSFSRKRGQHTCLQGPPSLPTCSLHTRRPLPRRGSNGCFCPIPSPSMLAFSTGTDSPFPV